MFNNTKQKALKNESKKYKNIEKKKKKKRDYTQNEVPKVDIR
jgi:hypothetical protein